MFDEVLRQLRARQDEMLRDMAEFRRQIRASNADMMELLSQAVTEYQRRMDAACDRCQTDLTYLRLNRGRSS